MNTLRFQAFGFPVNVQPTFLLLLGVFALFDLQRRAPLWAIASFSVIVFGSILIHELGHAATARALKLRVGEIHLHGMGGHVTHERSRPGNNLLVSLAGPGAGLVFGLPILGLYLWGGFSSPVVNEVLVQLIWVNVGWSIFNLMPMKPLDGGNALQSALELRMGPTRAGRITAIVGASVGLAFALLGLAINAIFFLALGAYMAWMNYQTWQRLR